MKYSYVDAPGCGTPGQLSIFRFLNPALPCTRANDVQSVAYAVSRRENKGTDAPIWYSSIVEALSAKLVIRDVPSSLAAFADRRAVPQLSREFIFHQGSDCSVAHGRIRHVSFFDIVKLAGR